MTRALLIVATVFAAVAALAAEPWVAEGRVVSLLGRVTLMREPVRGLRSRFAPVWVHPFAGRSGSKPLLWHARSSEWRARTRRYVTRVVLFYLFQPIRKQSPMARILAAASLGALALGALANDDVDARAKAEVEAMRTECMARATQASPEALIVKNDGTPMYGDDHPIVQKWAIVFQTCRQERIAQWKANAARLRAEAQRMREENQAAYQQQRE